MKRYALRLQAFLHSVAPGLLAALLPLALLKGAVHWGPRFNPSTLELMHVLPYLLLAALASLARQLNQSRATFVALALGLSYLWIDEPSLARAFHLGSGPAALVIAWGLPLGLILALIPAEARLLSRISALRLGLLILPALLIGVDQGVPVGFLDPLVALRLFPFPPPVRLNDLALLAPGMFALLLAIFPLPSLRGQKLALAVGMVPIFAFLNYSLRPGVPPAWIRFHGWLAFSGASFGLILAILKVYWHRIYVDELTQIPNRRALNEELERLTGRYVVGMVDIDHFKKFNDQYGHDAGDQVLRLVAQHLSERLPGKVFRYGGEEFTILADRASTESLFPQVDQARALLAERQFVIRAPRDATHSTKPPSKKNRADAAPTAKHSVKIHVSIGLASSRSSLPTPDRVLQAADQALYRAKESGRNRVVVFED